MNSSDFWYAVGDFFTETFKILPVLGDFVNWLYISIITIALIVWMFMQQKYNSAEMKESGKLK
ncbi:hypothetical protein KFE94_09195 [bacterium SCSIO 12643]|nr:hypothetical protein KFE94_09195 [bacterium SCSIO 12643]